MGGRSTIRVCDSQTFGQRQLVETCVFRLCSLRAPQDTVKKWIFVVGYAERG
jgi:hypothetical protein